MSESRSDPSLDTPVGAVHQRIDVPLSLPEAFQLFTDGIQEWWPLDEGYSYGGDRAKEVHLETRVGGWFFERFIDGDEFQVGTVTACEPPDRIVFTWRDPDWITETEVEVTFAGDDERTRVTLVHRGFDRLGPGWQDIAARWSGGWPRVIGAFAQRATGP